MTCQSQFKPKNKILLHQHIFKFKTWWVSIGRWSSLIGQRRSYYSATTTVLTHQVFKISLAYCCHVTKLSSLIGWAAKTLHNDPQNRVRVRFPVKSPFRYKLQATISTSGSMFRCYFLLAARRFLAPGGIDHLGALPFPHLRSNGLRRRPS